MKSRINIVQGGTSASKTISIILRLIHSAQSDKSATLTSIVSESVPHLKRGAIRDFKNIMKAHNYWVEKNWSASNSCYTFETGSQIEFFSSDDGDKLRGARRDRLFINEANNVSFDAFEQLEVRTKDLIFIDYNPTNEFWAFTELVGKRDDVEHIILTYLDNEGLDPQIIASIEQRKNRKGWWQVYGLGQLGEVEGKIYKGWQIIADVPFEARLVRRGLDFGYSNDPTVIVNIYEYNGGYIMDEITYQTGLINKQIADIVIAQEDKVLVMADSAEPKSIAEIRLMGVNIQGVKKMKDSVRNGIQNVQGKRISVTSSSINIIREYRNYLWKTDKDGKILNEPEHQFSHSMDAIRYGLADYKPEESLVARQFIPKHHRYNQLKR